MLQIPRASANLQALPKVQPAMRLTPKAVVPVNANSIFVPDRDVLSVRQAGQMALLSMSDRAYLTLNESAMLIWQSIRIGATVETAARHVATFYGISEDDARHDVSAMIGSLQAIGLIRPASGAIHQRDVPPARFRAQPARAGLPTAVECFGALARMTAALRLRGAARLVRDAMNDTEPDRGDLVPDEHARILTRRIRLAAAWLPWTGSCLPQSLAIVELLRRRGYQPYLRIGVYPFPFSAHAWVVCGGRPVNETTEQLMRYRVLEFDGSERL